jgi:hypothetical protein
MELGLAISTGPQNEPKEAFYDFRAQAAAVCNAAAISNKGGLAARILDGHARGTFDRCDLAHHAVPLLKQFEELVVDPVDAVPECLQFGRDAFGVRT